MLISLISFVAMNLKFQKYFVKYESSTITDSVASSGELLTLVGKVTNYSSTLISLKTAEQSEAKSAKQSFSSKTKIWIFLRF